VRGDREAKSSEAPTEPIPPLNNSMPAWLQSEQDFNRSKTMNIFYIIGVVVVVIVVAGFFGLHI
jgi:hypothetical protein